MPYLALAESIRAVLSDDPVSVPPRTVVPLPCPRWPLNAWRLNPQMVEWSPEVCQHMARQGRVVVDTRDADHEAGDLLQAGLDVSGFTSLRDVVNPQCLSTHSTPPSGPVMFKSCGWAGWDLAAARCCMTH